MNTTATPEFSATLDAAARAAATAKNDAGMSGFGVFWRVGGCLILFAAAIIAVVYGMQYAIGYIVALELSALVTSILTWTITGVGYVASAVIGWFTGKFCVKTMAAREAAKCAQSAKA